MNMWSLYNEPAMVIPFRHYDHDGRVVIYYGKNEDPVRAGFDIIPDLNFDINLCRGFPVMHARVEYSGLGYRQLFGWIQMVTDEYFQSGEKGERLRKQLLLMLFHQCRALVFHLHLLDICQRCLIPLATTLETTLS